MDYSRTLISTPFDTQYSSISEAMSKLKSDADEILKEKDKEIQLLEMQIEKLEEQLDGQVIKNHHEMDSIQEQIQTLEFQYEQVVNECRNEVELLKNQQELELKELQEKYDLHYERLNEQINRIQTDPSSRVFTENDLDFNMMSELERQRQINKALSTIQESNANIKSLRTEIESLSAQLNALNGNRSSSMRNERPPFPVKSTGLQQRGSVEGKSIHTLGSSKSTKKDRNFSVQSNTAANATGEGLGHNSTNRTGGSVVRSEVKPIKGEDLTPIPSGKGRRSKIAGSSPQSLKDKKIHRGFRLNNNSTRAKRSKSRPAKSYLKEADKIIKRNNSNKTKSSFNDMDLVEIKRRDLESKLNEIKQKHETEIASLERKLNDLKDEEREVKEFIKNEKLRKSKELENKMKRLSSITRSDNKGGSTKLESTYIEADIIRLRSENLELHELLLKYDKLTYGNRG